MKIPTPHTVIRLLLPLSALVYSLCAHPVIAALYQGRGPRFLNNSISQPPALPLAAYYRKLDTAFYLALALATAFYLAISLIVSVAQKTFRAQTDFIDSLPESRLGPSIALAAALGLYAELMIIRFHASSFQLFAYLKNVSLLSCFLGLGLGYLRSNRRVLTGALAMPLIALQVAFLHAMRFSPFAARLQNPIVEQISFGLNTIAGAAGALFSYGFLFLVFIFNAICFIPLGELTGRLMARKEKLSSYGWNLAGSLAGILVFSLLSFLNTPPAAWLILIAAALCVFLLRAPRGLLLALACTSLALIMLSIPARLNTFDFYSPYQVLSLKLTPRQAPAIETSNTYYQEMFDLAERHGSDPSLQRLYDYYSLPYALTPQPLEVLIVGSGSGNDVAAAIRNGAARVDAVEIDPVILKLGRLLHPESPYRSPRVTAIVDDARSFLKHTHKQYDLIVYGLLDSHVLLSGKAGGIRLDSYVYTVEGFRQARARLKENGALYLSFFALRPELGKKIFLMLREAFDGRNPRVFTTSFSDSCFSFLAGQSPQDAPNVSLPSTIGEITLQYLSCPVRADVSTDDWPFFYMPVRKYPVSYVLVIALLLAISLAMVHRSARGIAGNFSLASFFLGAGFMLIETKGITELALLFGSTWLVTSIVIAAILGMAFLANAALTKIKNPNPNLAYALIFASLLLGLGLNAAGIRSPFPWLERIISVLVLTVPVFFSGFAFSFEIKRAPSVSLILAANILGAMLGGFLEYNAMYFGFRSLYLLALLMYAAAFFGARASGNQGGVS